MRQDFAFQIIWSLIPLHHTICARLSQCAAPKARRGPHPEDAGGFSSPGGVTPYPRTECAGNVSTPLSFSHEKESAADGRKKELQRGICVGTNFTSLTLPQAAGLVRFVVPPFPARTASLGSRGSPFFGIPLKRPRRGLAPLLGSFPEFGFVQSTFQISKKRDADANRIDRRGSRNTLRLFRLPYVKYSTGANGAICKIYRALRKPDSTVARKGVQSTERETEIRTTERIVFLRVSAISRPLALFSPPSFLLREKRWCRRRHSCGVTAKKGTAVPSQKRPAHEMHGLGRSALSDM